MPIFPDNRSSNTSWLTVSNAADRSNITNTTTCWLSILHPLYTRTHSDRIITAHKRRKDSKPLFHKTSRRLYIGQQACVKAFLCVMKQTPSIAHPMRIRQCCMHGCRILLWKFCCTFGIIHPVIKWPVTRNSYAQSVANWNWDSCIPAEHLTYICAFDLVLF